MHGRCQARFFCSSLMRFLLPGALLPASLPRLLLTALHGLASPGAATTEELVVSLMLELITPLVSPAGLGAEGASLS